MDNNKGYKIVILIFILVFLFPAIPGIISLMAMLNIKLGWEAIFLIILGAIIAWVIATYNSLVSKKQKVIQARGGIDVYLKQRFDLIPNLVETVKAYKDYEEDIIEKITKLRQDFDNRNDNDVKESEVLNDRYTQIMAVVENYPELKASESFINLQKALSKIESQLQAARRIYNSEVTAYNITRCKFPSNIIANIFKFNEESLFEISENERVQTKVNM